MHFVLLEYQTVCVSDIIPPTYYTAQTHSTEAKTWTTTFSRILSQVERSLSLLEPTQIVNHCILAIVDKVYTNSGN